MSKKKVDYLHEEDIHRALQAAGITHKGQALITKKDKECLGGGWTLPAGSIVAYFNCPVNLPIDRKPWASCFIRGVLLEFDIEDLEPVVML